MREKVKGRKKKRIEKGRERREVKGVNTKEGKEEEVKRKKIKWRGQRRLKEGKRRRKREEEKK